jgi:trichohyalin
VDYFGYGPENRNWTPSDDELDVDRLLEKSSQVERERLEEALEEVDRQLEQRESIHRQSVEELESKLDWYLDRLRTLYKRPGTSDTEVEKVKEQVREFYEEIRVERRNKWRDRQELEKERRDLLRELSEVHDDKWILDFL